MVESGATMERQPAFGKLTIDNGTRHGGIPIAPCFYALDMNVTTMY